MALRTQGMQAASVVLLTTFPPPFLPRSLWQGVTRLAQHPTQPLVFTGSVDGTVQCWDTRTGANVRTWRGHRDAVQDLAVSPDGGWVLAGSEDGTARVFSMLVGGGGGGS